jgi:hypothetical protein
MEYGEEADFLYQLQAPSSSAERGLKDCLVG